jgi:hypothetical protein
VQQPLAYPPLPEAAAAPPNLQYQPHVSGLAIAGFICAFFCGVLGLIFSLVALQKIKASDGWLTGRGLAIAGVVISCVALLGNALMVLTGRGCHVRLG